MNLENFQAQLETEREWRESEIRFLDNNQRALSNDNDRKLMRRAILCLIYAHIEGFVQFAFSLYVDEINKENLVCSDVKPAIAAAALHKEFNALRNIDMRSKLLKNSSSDDKYLRRFSRDIEFVENIGGFYSHPISIPESFIDTNNNVGKEVLEKLLFQVGLEYEDLKSIYSPLTRLLNVRNDIAHGKRKAGIEDKEYQIFLDCSRNIISSISGRLTTAYGSKEFLKIPSSKISAY
ncbi:hypothetical protein N836_12800 [Leptolyngbya sp. Heron Island J]|uniref:MAE_28990/MAE_18760 family HEPN-like nuclease n=1 Tax=Leptolyngbya sp. Heron Island J TaxID=1385935 RepID=UPI0003B97FDF|nr:MAE_28990/MAE_18760 family HEPN-like nuclease [Leptolyngbya sp. Heron Island J]ESA35249.1 hypothetical protein N836_12800 [Leptolyngbya sp. Heron Island J]